jgi:serine/threonine protein kinase
MSFIHGHNIKYMDIKPKNILVQLHHVHGGYQIYIADFGHAKAYRSAEESSTDSPTSSTRTYAAPEAVIQDTRGFPADIFSLGCVFMEIFACIISTPKSD